METSNKGRFRIVIAVVCLLTCVFFVLPNTVMAQTLIITPTRLNLTSAGQSEALQAIIQMPIEEGYELYDYDVQLMFNNICLADAYSFTYCNYDEAFFASFNKQAIVANPVLLEFVGERVEFSVSGYYQVINATGNILNYQLSLSDYVWLMASNN